MVLTQDSVLSVLTAEGGKVRKSDLVEKFKGLVDCADPAEKARNRELFRTLVNNVAFVKEIDGDRFVVVKKQFQHLVEGVQSAETGGTKGIPPTGEQQRPPVRSASTERSEGAGGLRSADPDPELATESGENPSELLSPIELALQRTKYTDIKVRRKMNFDLFGSGMDGGAPPGKGASTQSKPYALPLRMPPSATRVEIRKLKDDPPEPDPCKNKRKPPSAEASGSLDSPQLRKAAKSTKAPEEPRYTRIPSTVPLEVLEHRWLVKCASGHWSQVHGMLLRDHQLAEKRDFISGFTVLHWAAKCGHREMLVKVFDISKQGGLDLDVNARTHGGYTPLHIAALHNQEPMMAMLVGEYGADVRVRDNCGKKALHYLHSCTSETLREMLAGRPRTRRAEHEKEEPDPLPDLSKGRNSISRLFQPHVMGLKKKDKQRPGFLSLSHDPNEEKEERSGGFRHRIMSDAFM